jgi:hypothetical protein
MSKDQAVVGPTLNAAVHDCGSLFRIIVNKPRILAARHVRPCLRPDAGFRRRPDPCVELLGNRLDRTPSELWAVPSRQNFIVPAQGPGRTGLQKENAAFQSYREVQSDRPTDRSAVSCPPISASFVAAGLCLSIALTLATGADRLQGRDSPFINESRAGNTMMASGRTSKFFGFKLFLPAPPASILHRKKSSKKFLTARTVEGRGRNRQELRTTIGKLLKSLHNS